MKKLVLTTALVGLVAASSFAQGTVTFSTAKKSDPVYSATDGTTATLALMATNNTVGSFGAVSYDLVTAPNGTAALTGSPSTFLNGSTIVAPSGWTLTPITPIVFGANPGVIGAVTVALSGVAEGATVEMEIIAFTGTANNVTLFGYSGQSLPTVTTGGISTWAYTTGSPDATPTPGVPETMPTGTSGLGSIILVPVPEPSTIALGGLAAAALLAFRRRK
jgi:hypothetical protein